jgi:hypothetical protein
LKIAGQIVNEAAKCFALDRMREIAHISRSDCYAKIRVIETPRLCVKEALPIYWMAAEWQTADCRLAQGPRRALIRSGRFSGSSI